MIGGLIEEEEIGPGLHELGQCQPAAFSAGEGRDGLVDVVPDEQVTSQPISSGPPPQASRRTLQLLQDCVLRIETLVSLGQVTYSQSLPQAELALEWLDLTQKGLDERRLSRTIRPDQSNPSASFKDDIRHFNQRSLSTQVADLKTTCLQNQRSRPSQALEDHPEGLVHSWRRDRFVTEHSFEPFASSLGLSCVLAGNVAPDVGLFTDYMLLLCLVGSELRASPLSPLMDVGRVVSVIRFKPQRGQFPHIVDGPVKEIAIMGNDHHRARPVLEPTLQPLHRLDIEMVCRLVQE